MDAHHCLCFRRVVRPPPLRRPGRQIHRPKSRLVKKSPKKGDSGQRAWAVVQQATDGSEPTQETDPRIVEGASKGGKARASKLTAEQRSEIAAKAAKARWGDASEQL